MLLTMLIVAPHLKEQSDEQAETENLEGPQ
jgi:hypothetical protein